MPIVILCALLVLQAFLLGVTTILAQSAAVQVARGVQEKPDLPQAWRSGAKVSRSAEQVTVRLRSPKVVPAGDLRISARSGRPEGTS
jgi:hypothetical protein